MDFSLISFRVGPTRSHDFLGPGWLIIMRFFSVDFGQFVLCNAIILSWDYRDRNMIGNVRQSRCNRRDTFFFAKTSLSFYEIMRPQIEQFWTEILALCCGKSEICDNSIHIMYEIMEIYVFKYFLWDLYL